MGWTSLHREPGQTDRQFFEAEFPGLLIEHGRILACATVRNVFYAAVQSVGKDHGRVWGLVVLIQRTRSDGGGDAWCNFAYKEMEEESGPAAARCPPRILDLLTDLPVCSHAEDYCQLCGRRIWKFGVEWVAVAAPGQVPECGGPRCYSGFIAPSGWVRGGPGPFHEAGGTAPCSTCYAREWRARCRTVAARQAIAARVKRGATVRFARLIRFGSGDERREFEFVGRSTFRALDGSKLYRIADWRVMDFKVEG